MHKIKEITLEDFFCRIVNNEERDFSNLAVKNFFNLENFLKRTNHKIQQLVKKGIFFKPDTNSYEGIIEIVNYYSSSKFHEKIFNYYDFFDAYEKNSYFKKTIRKDNGLMLYGSELAGLYLPNFSFAAALGCGINFEGADIEGGGFQVGDFSGGNFRDTLLSGADFLIADLNQCDFSGAILERTNFYGAILNRAKFCGANLFFANLRETELIDTDFTGANLISANFSGSVIRRASFKNADLRKAEINTAKIIEETDFSGAKMDKDFYKEIKQLIK
ncbi:MAG: pentapeptide repeat-containing protein [Candidatus Woesearchaeota archaeon]